MIKARVRRLERAFGGVEEPWKGTIRIAPFFDDEPTPVPGQGEDLILINVVRTPHPRRPPDPPTVGGAIADLQAEVDRLQAERDRLTAQASERESVKVPRHARSIVKNPGEKGGER